MGGGKGTHGPRKLKNKKAGRDGSNRGTAEGSVDDLVADVDVHFSGPVMSVVVGKHTTAGGLHRRGYVVPKASARSHACCLTVWWSVASARSTHSGGGQAD